MAGKEASSQAFRFVKKSFYVIARSKFLELKISSFTLLENIILHNEPQKLKKDL